MKHIKLMLTALVFAVTGTLAAAQDYLVQPGDNLSIEVLEDPSLNRVVIVLPDGRISFPFAGTIQASGRTASQIESAISAGIAPNFSTRPTVFVGVQPSQQSFSGTANPNLLNIYFLGQVNSPGLLQVEPGTTMLQGIAIGGGVTRFAAVKRIQLRRTNRQTGVQNVITLDYRALQNGTASQAIELKDGDVILVPERRLFE